MKVLHVEAGRHLYGGAQQVLYLLEGLAGHRVDNVLVCPDGSAIAAASPPATRVLTLPMKGDLDLALVPRLRRIIRDERPDVVHLHSRRGADTLGALAGLWTGARIVLSRRVDNPEPKLLARLKYRLYHRVITISHAIGRVLTAEGVDPRKIVCVHSAVRPDRWQSPQPRERLCEEFSLRPDAPVVGMAAQFIPRKGHDVLLAALPAVVEHFPDVQVLLFGKGREQEHVQRAVEREGLARNVLFAGFRDDLPSWFGALDLLVHPARREGLGVALLQAASAGLPIVASDAGGMGEIVIDGETGRLVPPGDAAALAEAMVALLGDRALAGRLGDGARRRVTEEFSVEAMTRGNLSVYEAVTGEEATA